MKIKKIFHAALAWSFVLLSPFAFANDEQGELTINDHIRTFLIHVPDRSPPAEGFPLILAFHGGGMQGEGMRRLTHLDQVADTRGFIVVYPNGIDKHWNDGRSSIKNPQDDVAFVSALIDRMTHLSRIDQERVYATGISNGALFAERLGCDLSGKIHGIAPVAGSLPSDLVLICHPRRAIAVMQIDGTKDPIMPFGGGAVSTLGGAGEGGDVISVPATASFWAKQNHCSTHASQQLLPPIVAFDRTRIMEARYQGCAPGAPVTLLSVIGGGHAWPGGPQYARPRVVGFASQQLDASETIASFFLSLPRAK
ncbi:PHB depolymerase family esterase [Robbsia sp. KACC 23696]|uniref:alpha/beta hydrolase family esterase n=1 Tax=Robbsia sp. KACC 23696 TaxID=3149231 RepID=UPI00325B6771